MNKNNPVYHINADVTLRRNPYDGVYFAFEGIDGAGKTVQVARFAEYLA